MLKLRKTVGALSAGTAVELIGHDDEIAHVRTVSPIPKIKHYSRVDPETSKHHHHHEVVSKSRIELSVSVDDLVKTRSGVR